MQQLVPTFVTRPARFAVRTTSPFATYVLAVGLALAVSACGSSNSNPAGPSGGSGGGSGAGGPGSGGSGSSGQNTISATIDGVSWTSATASGFVRNNIMSLAGVVVSGTTSTTLAFAATASAGTQSVGPGSGVNATYQIVGPTGAQGWQAAVTLGSGTVTIQTLTPTNAAGTFSFVLQPGSGATGIKSITNGTFNITF